MVKAIGINLSMKDLFDRLKHGLVIAFTKPQLAARIIGALIASRGRTAKGPKILVGTHHKVLTGYMWRVFSTFALITNRSISIGRGDEVDYNADIIIDHHSQFDFSRINFEYVGLHIRREPRDVVISSGFYHKRSDEQWLHIPRNKYGGNTYQQYINAIESLEDVFLFELDNVAGLTIRDMLNWNYERGFVEFKYEDLVTPDGGRMFRHEINRWSLSTLEKSLLEGLFNYYSVFAGRAKKGHVRDPRSKQFEQHFTAKLQKEFTARFSGALSKLGYS